MNFDDLEAQFDQEVKKTDRFKPVQYSQRQREAPLRPPANPVTWADLPEFEKRKTIRDVAFSTLPLMEAPFAYLRAGEESRLRGEGFWPGVMGATPQAQRQRRAIQSFYEGAREELPDWVQVLRQTGVPGGPFMKGFEYLSSAQKPILSGAGLGAGLGGPSAYLQSQSQQPGERLREAIQALPQSAAFGGAFGLVPHAVNQFGPRQIPPTGESGFERPEPFPTPQPPQPGEIRDVISRAISGENFDASRSALATALSSGPGPRPDISPGGNFPIRTSPAIERGLSGERPSVRQRLKQFRSEDVPVSAEEQAVDALRRPIPRTQATPEASFAPDQRRPATESEIQVRGESAPSYMATGADIASRYRTPEQIKAEKLGASRVSETLPQSRLDVNQEQVSNKPTRLADINEPVRPGKGSPLTRSVLEAERQPRMQQQQPQSRNLGNVSWLKGRFKKEIEAIKNDPDLTTTERKAALEEAYSRYENEVAAIKARRKEEIKTERFRSEESNELARQKGLAKDYELEDKARESLNPIPKSGRPSQTNWPEVARNWAGKDWATLTPKERNNLQSSYNYYLRSSGKLKRVREDFYQQQQGKLPTQPLKQRKLTKAETDLEIAQRQHHQNYTTSYEKEAVNDSLYTVRSIADLDKTINSATNNKNLPGLERRYFNHLQGYLNRHDIKSPKRNNIVNAYLDKTGGEVNIGVPIKELFPDYLKRVRSTMVTPIEAKGGKEAYIKDEQGLRQHLYRYGRRTTESFPEGELPSHAAPWVIDDATDKVYLNPYMPNKDGMQRFAQKAPLQTGLTILEKNPLESLIPDIPKGRVPQQSQQSGGGKPPIKRPPTELAGPPREPDEIRGPQRKKTILPGRRIEGGVQMEPADFGSTSRVGASGLPSAPSSKRKQKQYFINPDPRTDPMSYIERVFSPSSVSRKAKSGEPLEPSRGAEQISRAIRGQSKRQIAQAEAAMEPYVKAVYDLPEAAQLDFVHYIQTGGEEGNLAVLRKIYPKQTQKFENLTREIARIHKEVENEIRALSSEEKDNFITNYLSQIWKEKNAGRVMASTFLKERGIPTYKAGMELRDKNGKPMLTPKTTNPVEIVMMYLSAMRKFLDVKHIVQEGERTGYIQRVDARRAIEPNTAKLNFGGATKGGMPVSYRANEDFARVFNNFVSKGIYASPTLGKIYDAALHTKNFITGMNLGLAGYHALHISNETIARALGDGTRQISNGKLSNAAKAYGNSFRAPYYFYKKGDELMQAYLGRDFVDQKTERLAQLLAKSNMSVRDLDQVYRATAMGSYFRNISRALKEDKGLGATARAIGWAAKMEGKELSRGFKAAPVSTSLTAPLRIAAKVMETVAHPLFYKAIPTIKAGVWHERMEGYLRDNPQATEAELVRESQRAADVIDDQFGELAQDNIFWDAHLKQLANLLVLSPGWTIGDIRLFGQGTADVARGIGKTVTSGRPQPLTDRAAYLIGMAATISALGAIYLYLKTGEYPKSVEDLAAPRTGGKTILGDPERIILPGYQKDVMGYFHDPKGEIWNKFSGFSKTSVEEWQNKDWRGDPIRTFGPDDDFFTRAFQAVGHAFGTLEPIALTSMLHPTSPETNVSAAERFMGIRPAGAWITSPEVTEARDRKAALKAWRLKKRHEERDKARGGYSFDEFLEPAPAPAKRGYSFDKLLEER